MPHPAVPLRPGCPGPCSGNHSSGQLGKFKGKRKSSSPTVCEGLGLDPHSPCHSLKPFRAINGFSRSELANEPAWEAAGTEGLQTGAVEGESGS